MLKKVINPYRIVVSEKARLAGFENRNFPNKKVAIAYIKKIRVFDPKFTMSFRIVFRYIDTSTGQLFQTRTEYRQEQDLRMTWAKQNQKQI